MQPIVFVNIGWMKKYQGHSPADELNPGAFGYFKKEKHNASAGHEQWNFKPTDGWVYGYVPASVGINITRLGAKPSDTSIENVLVVFVSQDPLSRQHVVVGWYKNASIHREQAFRHQHPNMEVWASIRARAQDVHLRPVAERGELPVPTRHKSPGGIGQSPIWYATEHPDVVAAVRAAVAGKTKATVKAPAKSKKPPRQPDTEKRLLVEEKAMRAAMAYFDDAEDVSLQRKGWDIEAAAEGQPVFIEVKGLSGADVLFELTPNEYEMMRKHRDRYLVFVVTNALAPSPVSRTFRFDLKGAKKGLLQWISEHREVLKLTEAVSARCAIA